MMVCVSVGDDLLDKRRRRRRAGDLRLSDEDLSLAASAHWRLLQALHGDRGGQLP
jgi:hypothetical protein